MYATYGNVHFINWECEVIFLEVQYENTTLVTAVSIQLLVQGLFQMLMRYSAVGDRCQVYDSFLPVHYEALVTALASMFQPLNDDALSC